MKYALASTSYVHAKGVLRSSLSKGVKISTKIFSKASESAKIGMLVFCSNVDIEMLL